MGNNSEFKTLEMEKLRKRRLRLIIIFIVELIVLIGFGYMIYKNNNSAMGALPITLGPETYNSSFIYYEGTQKGANVKSLCDTIANHNRTHYNSEKIMLKEGVAEDTEGPSTQEELFYTTIEHINNIKNKVSSGQQYNVTFGYKPETGFITTVGVQEVISGEGTKENSINFYSYNKNGERIGENNVWKNESTNSEQKLQTEYSEEYRKRIKNLKMQIVALIILVALITIAIVLPIGFYVYDNVAL